MTVDLSQIKALTFDVGGTVFDWRGAIESEVGRIAQRQGADVDVPQFATDWRRGMFAMLARVRSRELPWMNADQLHRAVLDDVMAKHDSLTLSASERDELNGVWHRLDAWPDAPAAIERLRGRYTVVVLTVLSWAIAVDCSKRSGIGWDGILSCEFLGDYKPDAPAYRAGVRLLGLEPEQTMMVAAHPRRPRRRHERGPALRLRPPRGRDARRRPPARLPHRVGRDRHRLQRSSRQAVGVATQSPAGARRWTASARPPERRRSRVAAYGG